MTRRTRNAAHGSAPGSMRPPRSHRRNPAGLRRWDLGGRIEPGADPCAAFLVLLVIGAEQTTEVLFVLGLGRDLSHAVYLARHWQEPWLFYLAFEELNLL